MKEVKFIRLSQINLFYAEALDVIMERLDKLKEEYVDDMRNYEEGYEATLENSKNEDFRFNSFNDWSYIEYIKRKSQAEYVDNVKEALLKVR